MRKEYKRLIYFFIVVVAIAWLILGCGSRKVETTKTDKESETQSFEIVKKNVLVANNVKIENVTKVDTDTKEIVEEEIIEADDKTKPAIYEKKELGNLKITKRKINRSTASKKENNTNTLINEKKSDNTTKTSQKTQSSKENVETKAVDRKQFDIVALLLSYWWLVLLILLALYFYRKYKTVLVS